LTRHLLALAIRLDQLIRDGVVADQAELARLGHVSRARLTQIMNLLYLAVRDSEVTWRIGVGRELTFGRNSCSDASIEVTEALDARDFADTFSQPVRSAGCTPVRMAVGGLYAVPETKH